MTAQDLIAKAIGSILWSESFEGTDDYQRSQFMEASKAAVQTLAAAGFVIVPKEPNAAMQRVIVPTYVVPGDTDPFIEFWFSMLKAAGEQP